MRLIYEVQEVEEYHLTRDLLTRRCCRWAGQGGSFVEPAVVSAALDSRQYSADGRLTYWSELEIRTFLLDWLPRRGLGRTVPERAGRSLRALLGYLNLTGLRDRRGVPVHGDDAAIAAAFAESPDQTDRTDGPMPPNHPAGAAVVSDGVEMVEVVGAASDDRVAVRLAVLLPPPEELTACAEDSRVSEELTTITEWVAAGPDGGRELFGRGFLGDEDAESLATALGHRPCLQGVDERPEAGGASIPLAWAKRVGLIRRHRGRLVPVAKARLLLTDAERLWHSEFEASFGLATPICRPIAAPDRPGLPSAFESAFGRVTQELLDKLYLAQQPVPLALIQIHAWRTSLGPLADATPAHLPGNCRMRDRIDTEVATWVTELWRLGAITASPRPLNDLVWLDPHFDRYRADPRWLAERANHPEPIHLELTGLGVRALRARLLAQGRDAPLVGELIDADPATLLNQVMDRYRERECHAEIAAWTSVNGTDLEPLLDAVRRCPLRVRAQEMLGMLARVTGTGVGLFHRLRSDPALAPLALNGLTLADELTDEQLTDTERALLTVEALLQLTELSGTEFLAAEWDRIPFHPLHLAAAARWTGEHPDRLGVADLEAMIAERLPGAPPGVPDEVPIHLHRVRGRPGRVARGSAHRNCRRRPG